MLQGGAPKIAKLVYNPINYRYIYQGSPSENRVISQLNYLGGTTFYVPRVDVGLDDI